MNTYKTSPINTNDVVLSDDLLKLAESMAENVHDVWAESRIREGWTYGEHRDDTLKTHPCLVPYQQLPESEKAYDRDTAITTLKLIVKSGFYIIPRK